MYTCEIMVRSVEKRVSTVIILVVGVLQMAMGQNQTGLKKPLVYYTSAYSVAVLGAGYYVGSTVKGYTAADLSKITINSLHRFDRDAARQNYKPARPISDILAISSVGLPGIISLMPRVRKDFYTYNIVYAQAIFSTMGQVMLLKGLTKKARPYVYNTDIAQGEKLLPKARLSFPSGHTAISSAACFFGAYTYSKYYSDSKYKPLVWAVAAILPAATGYMRYRAGKHFVSDIATGYAIGAFNGILFPVIFKIGRK